MKKEDRKRKAEDEEGVEAAKKVKGAAQPMCRHLGCPASPVPGTSSDSPMKGPAVEPATVGRDNDDQMQDSDGKAMDVDALVSLHHFILFWI